MCDNARLANMRHDPIGDITGAFGRPAGEYDHVAGRNGIAQSSFDCGLFVSDRAKGYRLAPILFTAAAMIAAFE